ncbi:DUF1232 domain-containing protein [candidate division WWE3 bacterium]|nr:DUF1232 domain-containing protein [candidate division WWE3 bacterium]
MSENVSGDNEKKVHPLSWVLAILGGGYAAWPLDAVPDALPLAGWVDDIGLILVLLLLVVLLNRGQEVCEEE